MLLQDQKSHKDFSQGCRTEVQRYEQESARDYRLNYRLYKECKRDISKVCKDACQLKEGELCGGKVGAGAAEVATDWQPSAAARMLPAAGLLHYPTIIITECVLS
jgi:hypothetical protein